jgi:uncharacterized protein involved in exopolysaccharide biosynthesis
MESEFRISEYVRILKKRYLYLLVPFIVLFGASVGVATLLPPLYQSTGVILIESPQISKEIVTGAIDSAARERIEVIKQRVMTRVNLIRIANQFEVFRDEEKKLSSSEIVEEMRSASTVDFVSSGVGSRVQTTIAFTVSFQHRSPQTAARVANEIVTLFMDENVKTRTKIATETTDFLNQEAKKLEDHLGEIEAKIAQYKQENSSALPENLDIRIGIRERTETQIRETDREIKANEEEMRFLDIQLSALKSGYGQVGIPRPSLDASPSKQVEASEILSTAYPALGELQAELSSAKAKYSPSHPDLKRLTRELEALEEQLIAEGGVVGISVEISRWERKLGLAQAEDDDAAVEAAKAEIAALQEELQIAVSNQADQNLPQQQQTSLAEAQALAEQARAKAQAELNIANVEAKISVAAERISSLREQKEELKARLAEVEQSILQTPLVDRALKSLNRDYENAQQKYNDVRAKAMEAQIAENVEEASKAERFVIVEPPTLPDEPIKPNRLQLIIFGLGASLFAGLGSVVGIEFIDGSIRGANVLASVMSVEPLAIIPYIVTAEEVRSRKRMRLLLFIGMTLFVVLVLAGIHFVYKPLDEVFYTVVDRFS